MEGDAIFAMMNSLPSFWSVTDSVPVRVLLSAFLFIGIGEVEPYYIELSTVTTVYIDLINLLLSMKIVTAIVINI